MNERDEFNKNYNLSYVDESLPAPDNKIIFRHISDSLTVYLLVYLILCINPLFKSFFSDFMKNVYIYALFIYMILAPIIYFIFRPKSVYASHNVHVCNYFRRCLKNLKEFRVMHSFEDLKVMLRKFKPDYYEKSSMILIFIKMFFGVIMSSGFLNDINVIKERWQDFAGLYHAVKSAFVAGLPALKNVIYTWRNFIYYNLLLLLFTIDLLVYSIGYLTEFYWFKNKIRTVETTIAGLFFCLMCYPPMVNATNSILGWNYYENSAAFGNSDHPITWICRFASVFFLIIFVSASVALGTKASNLTNRGTVSVFPYNIVRHPAYSAKIMIWLFQFIPLMFIPLFAIRHNPLDYLSKIFFSLVALLAYALIYYLRALTEERHLMHDPDYLEYQKKVKWQFIPGVF